MLHRFILYAIVCLGSSFQLTAQLTVVSGRVFDAESGAPLPYVNVAFTSGTEGTVTNEKGAFRLSTDERPGRLYVSFLGYNNQSHEVIRGIEQSVDIALEPRSFELLAAEVRPDKNEVNPAKPLMQRVIEAKQSNDPSAVPAAKHRLHARMEFDINDISEEQTKRWYWGPFDWVFNYMDSSEARVALPFVLGEIIADEVWQSNPRRKQTEVVATQMSGDMSSANNAAEMNARFPDINLYENQLLILDRAFTSPLHNRAQAHYRYYILDTLNVNDRPAFHLAFIPRRKGEMTFEGELWIDTLSLGLCKVDARLSPSANVNFVRHMGFEQSYSLIASQPSAQQTWMLQSEKMLIDISLTDRTVGAYLRRQIECSDQEWNASWPDSTWTAGRDLSYDSSAKSRGPEEWDALRISELSARERGIIEMTDSIVAMPQWRFVKGLGYGLGTGYALAGPLEIGAWWSAYTTNSTEGNRFRLDLRTSNNFSTRFMPKIFAAYGTNDLRWKGGFNARYILNHTPRTELFFEIKQDLEQFGMAGLLDQGEAFTNAIRTDTTNLLSEVFRAETSMFHEFGKGFTGFFEWRHRQVGTTDAWSFQNPTNGQPIDRLITSEATAILRFAHKERFLSGEFDRVSLGTEWPIVSATVTWGMPNVLGSQYNYTRYTLDIEDEIRLGWWGHVEWVGQAGYYGGSAPFPLMEVVPTSGTFLMSSEAFNLLKFYENVADQWVRGTIEWHAEGLLLNHLPLIRRLELREVASVRAISGSWDPKHEQWLELPVGTTGLSKPYIECGLGLENILGGLRVDAVWRTDKSWDQPGSWSLRLGFSPSL